VNAVMTNELPEARVQSQPAEPVFILAPPCTFSWAVCAMLGEHPEMYALPELHLFGAGTVAEWLAMCSDTTFEMDHGLVRTIAELYFGEQTDVTASRARGWLRRRGHFTTGLLLEAIVERLSPLIALEKSPSIVHRVDTMQAAWEMFPTARFVHLVSHPRLYCEVVMQSLRNAEGKQPLPPSHWLVQLASPRAAGARGAVAAAQLDPQFSWLAANRTIAEFLAEVPQDQWTVLRGEELMAQTGEGLAAIANWLGVRSDAAAVDDMRHPERSPYARRGPASAAFGSDAFLREGPLLGADWGRHRTSDGPLRWRADGRGFEPEVIDLAQQFGYA
jgi:hypothetical protein